jgi:hypothetical protein
MDNSWDGVVSGGILPIHSALDGVVSVFFSRTSEVWLAMLERLVWLIEYLSVDAEGAAVGTESIFPKPTRIGVSERLGTSPP